MAKIETHGGTNGIDARVPTAIRKSKLSLNDEPEAPKPEAKAEASPSDPLKTPNVGNQGEKKLFKDIDL